MSDSKKTLPEDPAARKAIPLATGCYDYFPDALVAVAEVSFIGNEKHNPGEPLHHARGKSNDHADALQRHFMDRGGFDTITLPDGRVFKVRSSAEMAWRALALLQEELEAAGAPLARGATLPEPDPSQLPAEPKCPMDVPGCDGSCANPPASPAGWYPAVRYCGFPNCGSRAVVGGFCDLHKAGTGG